MFGRRLGLNGLRSGLSDDVELIGADAMGTGDSSAPHQALMFPPAAAGPTSRGAAVFGSRAAGTRPADMSDQSRLLRGGRHARGLARFGLPKGSFMLYVDDLYHTLLNMPRYRFLMSFFTVYLSLYLVFSFFYVGFKADCVGGEEDMNFARSFWFSVWTASTIGYSGDLGPNPNCGGLNTIVTFQIMVAALIDTMLMSLVFSRFAAPMPRASTIRFSTHAVLARHQGTSLWAVSFRLANIRKHSLLEPEIQLLLAIPESRSSGGVSFKFRRLITHDELTQVTSLKLGLPATVTHIITPDSPMYNLSLTAMEAQGIELLCFMSGIDPMTSNQLQAQHAWRPSEIRMNERFVGVQLATKQGRLGLDLSAFDITSAAEGMGIKDDSQAVLCPVPAEAGQSTESVAAHMADLRKHTLRSLSGARGRMAGPDSSSSTEDAPLVGGGVGLGASAGLPPLPPSQPAGVLDPGSTLPVPPAQQWDASVRALCEAIVADVGACSFVRQRAAALREAMLAVPGGSPVPPIPLSQQLRSFGSEV